MFTQMLEKKIIKLFKEREFVAIIKKYKQLENINVVIPETPNAIRPEQKRNNLDIWTSSRRNDAVKLKGKHVLMVLHRGVTYPLKKINNQLYP